jgi:hypothetical protein
MINIAFGGLNGRTKELVSERIENITESKPDGVLVEDWGDSLVRVFHPGIDRNRSRSVLLMHTKEDFFEDLDRRGKKRFLIGIGM